jgi:guanylate kinase
LRERGALKKRSRSFVFIVSGPSGVGKTTLYKEVAMALPNLKHSISYTTRPPRPGEVNDREYTFISRDEFRAMVQKGEFVEWAEIFGELYGTSRKRLEEIIDSGVDVILDIDIQGAAQLKNTYTGGVYIFLLPPTMKVLKERLEKRMADLKGEIEKRLQRVVDEIRHFHEYDYVIVNNTLKDALRELKAIIISHRVRTERVDPLWIEENFLK